MADKKYHIKQEEKQNTLNDNQIYYEAAEKARIKESILRTDVEKFYVFMRLMKINRMLKNAKITHTKIED